MKEKPKPKPDEIEELPDARARLLFPDFGH
jgi:hypothetical protein